MANKILESWCPATTDVVFLGAGFSRSVSGGTSPLMFDFFDELDDRKYWLLSKFLTECFDDPRAANVEEALLKLDQLCIGPLQGKDAFIDQCRARQTELKRELDSYILERLGKVTFSEAPWAAELLLRVSDTSTVITTNYDNLAESTLSSRPNVRHRGPRSNCHHCRMCRILTEECMYGGVIGHDNEDFWRGSLLKLHGSVAWKMCSSPGCESQLCLVPDPTCRPLYGDKCDCCKQACSPVLVHPSMQKSFDRFRGLRRMWDGAFEALRVCRTIAFFGFSFPTSDAIVSEMIRCTLGRSQGDLEVIVVDVSPEIPAKRFQELVSRRRDPIQLTTLQIDADCRAPEWYVNSDAMV
jgi:hypothetical protein